MTKFRTGIVLALLLGIGIFGCSKNPDATVVTINGEDIPVSLIHRFFDSRGTVFGSYEEEFKTKRDAIDSLIDYKLLVKGAYDAGLGNDPEIEKLVSAQRANFLFDELYRVEVAQKLEVTDQELREFYDKLKKERRLAHILVATQAEADSALRAVNAGADFGGVARQISLDQSTAVRGGEMGFVSWGANLVDEFRDAAFALKVGEVSQPVKTQFGYHLIKVLEERDAELQPYAEMQPIIRQVLSSRKSMRAETDFLQRMQEKAAVQVNEEATQMLLERLDMYYPDTLNGAPRPDNYFPNLELLKPFEQQMVFASYTGGEVTVEGYINKLTDVPEAYRPRLDNLEAVRSTVFQLELKNILEYEADQRKIGERTEYQKRITDFREGLMVDKFVRQILGGPISASEDEIYEYYNTHSDEFSDPMQLHLLEIQQDSVAQIERIIDQLREGADFAQLARQYTNRDGARQSGGDLGWVTAAGFPRLWEAAARLSVGQWSDLILNESGKYSVVKVLEIKQAALRPITDVTAAVQQKVIDLKRSSAMVDWLREQRGKAKIEIHENVLEKTIDKTKYANQG